MKMKERLGDTDLLLLTGLFLGVVKTGFLLSHILFIPEWLDSLLTAGMCGCFGLHVLLQKPGFPRLALYALLAAAGAYSCLRSNDMSGIITILTCIALAGCDFDRVVRKLFWWNLGAFAINAVASVILALVYGPEGTIVHTYDYFSELGINYAISLGYDHKNMLGMHLFNIFLLWTWWRYPTLRIRQLLAVSLGLALFLLLCQCKTTVVLVVLVCLWLCWFLRTRKDTSPLVQTAAALAPGAALLFSFGCVYLYRQGKAFAAFVDKLLTGRISLCASAWEYYGLTFFGHVAEDLAQLENTIAFMDNAYLYSLVEVGGIWAIAFCLVFFLVAKRSKDPRVHLLILCWTAYSMVEVVTFHGFRFLPALLPALLLSSQKAQTPAAIP